MPERATLRLVEDRHDQQTDPHTRNNRTSHEAAVKSSCGLQHVADVGLFGALS